MMLTVFFSLHKHFRLLQLLCRSCDSVPRQIIYFCSFHEQSLTLSSDLSLLCWVFSAARFVGAFLRLRPRLTRPDPGGSGTAEGQDRSPASSAHGSRGWSSAGGGGGLGFMAIPMSPQLAAFLRQGAGMEGWKRSSVGTRCGGSRKRQPGWSSPILLFLGWGDAGSRSR